MSDKEKKQEAPKQQPKPDFPKAEDPMIPKCGQCNQLVTMCQCQNNILRK